MEIISGVFFPMEQLGEMTSTELFKNTSHNIVHGGRHFDFLAQLASFQIERERGPVNITKKAPRKMNKLPHIIRKAPRITEKSPARR